MSRNPLSNLYFNERREYTNPSPFRWCFLKLHTHALEIPNQTAHSSTHRFPVSISVTVISMEKIGLLHQWQIPKMSIWIDCFHTFTVLWYACFLSSTWLSFLTVSWFRFYSIHCTWKRITPEAVFFYVH